MTEQNLTKAARGASDSVYDEVQTSRRTRGGLRAGLVGAAVLVLALLVMTHSLSSVNGASANAQSTLAPESQAGDADTYHIAEGGYYGSDVLPSPEVVQGAGRSGAGLLTFHHYVSHISTISAIAGEPTQLYVREKVIGKVKGKGKGKIKDARDKDRADLGSTPGRGEVVLMVHGATAPSSPAFDLSYQDYSWMGSLAEAGFDVFAMDHVGFGWSTRPWPMDDPCNARLEDQAALLQPYPLDTPCPPSYPFLLTNAHTAADEIDQVVEYLRSLRQVERIHLIGYSAGGARFGSYAALHPDKVDKLILLAPGYRPDLPTNPPAELPAPGFSLLVGRADLPLLPLPAHCGAGIEPGLLPVFRAALEESDPVGATWGAGVLRAPTYQPWGWNATRAAQVQAPTLLMSGEFDSVVPQAGVRQLYNDLGSDQKVFVDIACSQHTVPLETRHNIVHEASLEWLLQGSVQGLPSGTLRLGD